MKLIFATTNANKVISPKRVLAQYGVELVQASIELPELQAETVAEVAVSKARAAHELLKEPVMIVDSGFCIPALKGFPGPNVKWVTRQIGLEGYLRLLTTRGGWLSHDCWFEDVLAYMDGAMTEPKLFVRKVNGTLAPNPAGAEQPDQKSALWRLFVPDGCSVTLAQMSPTQIADVRGRADHEKFYHDFAKYLLAHDTPVP